MLFLFAVFSLHFLRIYSVILCVAHIKKAVRKMYKTTNFKAQTPVYASTVVVKTVSAIWNYCHLNVTSQTCPLCYTYVSKPTTSCYSKTKRLWFTACYSLPILWTCRCLLISPGVGLVPRQRITVIRSLLFILPFWFLSYNEKHSLYSAVGKTKFLNDSTFSPLVVISEELYHSKSSVNRN